MKTSLLLFLVAVVWHFVYDGIIAPSIRLHLRNQLFILRDELRQVLIDGIPEVDKKAFWFVHGGINNFINRLPGLTIERAIALSEEYENNTKLQQLLDKNIDAVKNSDSRIKEVFDKVNSVIEVAFIANMGGWFIYIIPVAVVWLVMSNLSRLATNLIVAPDKDVERFLPNAYV